MLHLFGIRLMSARLEESPKTPTKTRFLSSVVNVALAASLMNFSTSSVAIGQVGLSEDGKVIERVEVVLLNPSSDTEKNQRISDLIRRELQIFPGTIFNRAEVELAVATSIRQASVASAQLMILPGGSGGVTVNVNAKLSDDILREDRGYLLSNRKSDLPVLYDKDGTVIIGKLETLAMLYGNVDAWYGRPDLFLAGNPLISGTPAGSGASGWAEGFVHGGVYGLTPLADDVYAYGGVSAIVSGSAGTELFTDESRAHLAFEDAYLGLVGGETTEAGDRFVWNLSAGRKRYAIGDSMIIGNSASNGSDRAALQSNPRWAADMLALAQFRYNTAFAEFFYLDPDELPVVDSRTAMAGVNIGADVGAGFNIGASFIRVLESDYSYFALTPPDPVTATLGRDGLEVFDARLRWNQPNGSFFGSAEVAVQRNENFDMFATALAGEIGYRFSDLPWTPVLSYRYAQFSGDDPDTARFERWDPLLSGGNGEQWVQGINHFKIFQDSNLITHRFQVRLRPSPQVELVPQFWIFTADSSANLGGNPALSFLASDELGYEANLTAKWFISPSIMLQGHVAATFPGAAAEAAAGGDLDPWWSAMAFLRVAY